MHAHTMLIQNIFIHSNYFVRFPNRSLRAANDSEHGNRTNKLARATLIQSINFKEMKRQIPMQELFPLIRRSPRGPFAVPFSSFSARAHCAQPANKQKKKTNTFWAQWQMDRAKTKAMCFRFFRYAQICSVHCVHWSESDVIIIRPRNIHIGFWSKSRRRTSYDFPWK